MKIVHNTHYALIFMVMVLFNFIPHNAFGQSDHVNKKFQSFLNELQQDLKAEDNRVNLMGVYVPYSVQNDEFRPDSCFRIFSVFIGEKLYNLRVIPGTETEYSFYVSRVDAFDDKMVVEFDESMIVTFEYQDKKYQYDIKYSKTLFAKLILLSKTLSQKYFINNVHQIAADLKSEHSANDLDFNPEDERYIFACMYKMNADFSIIKLERVENKKKKTPRQFQGRGGTDEGNEED
jgi:hypothetical protein